MDNTKMLSACKAWWDSICLQVDPIRRPRLTAEAFQAGYKAGIAAREAQKESATAAGSALQRIRGICAQTHTGQERAYTALSTIDQIARHAMLEDLPHEAATDCAHLREENN